MLKYTAQNFLWNEAVRQDFSSGRCYDLYLVLRGTAAFRCGAAILRAGAEDMVIFKPGEIGTLEFAGGRTPFEMIRVQLTSEVLEELSDEQTSLLAAFNVVPFRQISVRVDSELYMLLKNLARKLVSLPRERAAFGAAIFEHSLLQMFVVLALRAGEQAERHQAQVSRRHLMFDDVFLYIQAHLDEELTLARLEQQFYVSHEHISREFKRQTGQTIHRYIVRARLDRCCRYIEQGYPIIEVYKMGGFGDYNHFFRAFKKAFGMTPKEYFRTTSQTARG